MLNRAFSIPNQNVALGFTDVVGGQWYYGDVVAAKAAGYIGGYSDGTFKPEQSISRQEVASILVRLLKLESTEAGLDKYSDNNMIQDWARGSVGAVVNSGLMAGFLTTPSSQPRALPVRKLL
ncbi:hypothetical protein N752_00160 [Desulforamulus aquiferis]|nr:S-layer homology domain-containing protein [Desulforamulus aquiferis]RYD07027.1 hypothetical protein N752_00160 [Desulforamulus aquiferis]